MPPTHLPPVTGTWKGQPVTFLPDRLVVSVRHGYQAGPILTSIQNFLETQTHTQTSCVINPARQWTVFRLASPLTPSLLLDLAGQIAADPRIRYAEPAVLGETHLVPTEPKYGEQWWPDKIRATSAWDLTTGNSKLLLGVMDSGICIAAGTSPDHPDLSGTRYIVRHGTVMHDYVSGDDIPRDEHYDGHGTHVTGIAAADGHNGVGVAGMNWNCNVYIARVADACGSFSSDNLKTAVADLLDYANGVYDRVVVNMSMGTQADVDHLKEMCDDAGTFAGKVLFVCAAGKVNANLVDIDWPAAYAAAYDFVIAVSATDENDAPCALVRDNYDKITLFAPGNKIYSTLPTYARDPCTDADGIVHNSGDKDYGSLSGTSMAAPLVSGVASLMWTLNDGLSPAEIIAMLISSAKIIPYQMAVRDSTGHATWVWTSHYRVDAGSALEWARPPVELAEAHVLFGDVPVGTPVEKSLIFEVGADCTVSFEVVEDSIALGAALTVSPLAAAYDPGMGGVFKLITVKYEPTVEGDVSYGQFRVKSVEACREWTVFVTASAATAVTTAAIIVADRSGSMSEESGIENMTRMEVLQEAASIVVETIRVGDAIGVTAFSTEASAPVGVTAIVGADPMSPERANVKAKIAGLMPAGSTSIAAGVELAANMLSGDAHPLRGMMVLTDGRENTEPFINDVMGGVHVPVYAIGMGTAYALQPDTLLTLTEATGGYLLLTDALDSNARFRVAKYAMQMLAGMTGDSLLLDPTTTLRPRQQLLIPFSLCGDDRSFAVTLLTPWPNLVRMTVRDPRGHDVTADGRGILRIIGKRVISHRFPLPIGDVHAGEWNVVLSIDENSEREIKERSEAAGYRIPGAPCSVLVTARSALSMRCRALAASRFPGSRVTLRASLSRRGNGYDDKVRVAATIRRRHDEPLRISLARSAPGIFEGTFVASESGVYECVIRASGTIPGAERFCREQTVTAQTWSGDISASDRDRAKDREARRRQT